MVSWEQDEKFLLWAEERLAFRYPRSEVTWLTSLSSDGSVRGVVVFSRWSPMGCELTVVGAPGWITKDFAKAVAGYVWLHADAKRVTAIIAEGNEKSLNLAAQLGFQVEGHLRNWFLTGDAKILGLLRNDCKFLRILSGLSKPGTSS